MSRKEEGHLHCYTLSLSHHKHTHTRTHTHNIFDTHTYTEMPSTPKHSRINGQQPFKIKQIKGNYWWPANCLKTNDKTAASCEDGRLRDALQGDWHPPYTRTHTHTLCVQREYLLLVGGSFHVGDQSWLLTEGCVFRPRFNCRLCRHVAFLIHPGPVCFTCFLLFINWFALTLPNFSAPTCTADIAQRYRISKYPTLKLFRNGMMMKREYRGQRSVVAIADFIRQQQVDPVKELHSLDEVQTLDVSVVWMTGSFRQGRASSSSSLTRECLLCRRLAEQEEHHRLLWEEGLGRLPHIWESCQHPPRRLYILGNLRVRLHFWKEKLKTVLDAVDWGCANCGPRAWRSQPSSLNRPAKLKWYLLVDES